MNIVIFVSWQSVDYQIFKNYIQMKVKYDIETDILYIKLSEKPIIDSDEDKPGLILDFSEDGSLIGIDISGAAGEYSFAMAA